MARHWLLIVLVGILCGCSSSTPPAPAPIPYVPPPLAPPGQAAAERCAAEIARCVQQNDAAGYHRLFDWGRILEEPEHFVEANDLTLRTTTTSLLDSVRRNMGEGTFDLVRIHRQGNEVRAQFRMCGQKAELLLYYEYLLTQHGDEVRIADLVELSTGNRLEEDTRQVATLASDPAASQLIGRMGLAVQQQDGKEALAAYREMSSRPQQIHLVGVLRIQAALLTRDQPEIQAALTSFRERFPKEPALPLFEQQAATLAGDPTAALAALDRFAPVVDHDPYLDIERAGILLASGQRPPALAAAQRAAQALPQHAPTQWFLANLYLRMEDYDRLVEQLKSIDERFDPPWEMIETEDAYAAFRKTEQYRAWQEYVEKKEP